MSHMSQPPNGISIGSAVFAQRNTHIHTDHATCDIIVIDRNYTVYAMRPKMFYYYIY